MKNNLDHHLYPSELDGQDYDKKHNYASENVWRERSSLTTDDDAYSDVERHDGSSQVAGQYLKRYHHSGRSRSGVDDMPSISSWHSWEKHTNGHRSSKKRNDQREHCDCDSSWTDSKRKIVRNQTILLIGKRCKGRNILSIKQNRHVMNWFMIGGRWLAGQMKKSKSITIIKGKWFTKTSLVFEINVYIRNIVGKYGTSFPLPVR